MRKTCRSMSVTALVAVTFWSCLFLKALYADPQPCPHTTGNLIECPGQMPVCGGPTSEAACKKIQGRVRTKNNWECKGTTENTECISNSYAVDCSTLYDCHWVNGACEPDMMALIQVYTEVPKLVVACEDDPGGGGD